MTENERFGLVFAKTGSINSGTEQFGVQNNSLWRILSYYLLLMLCNPRLDCYSTGLTAFLNLLRKDLGRSKPAIFPP
jgi:hypothetical protein